MNSSDVIKLYKLFENNHISLWLDGGWGVDALIGKQTRKHEDVDIIIQKKDVSKTRNLLEKNRFVEVVRDDTSWWNFVMGDDSGHLVDIHVIELDDDKNGIYGPPEKHVMYPANSLTGIGSIDDYKVKCLTAAYQLESHSGYKLRDKDFQDIDNLKKIIEYDR